MKSNKFLPIVSDKNEARIDAWVAEADLAMDELSSLMEVGTQGAKDETTAKVCEHYKGKIKKRNADALKTLKKIKWIPLLGDKIKKAIVVLEYVATLGDAICKCADMEKAAAEKAAKDLAAKDLADKKKADKEKADKAKKAAKEKAAKAKVAKKKTAKKKTAKKKVAKKRLAKK